MLSPTPGEVQVLKNEKGPWVLCYQFVRYRSRRRLCESCKLGFQNIKTGRVLFQTLTKTIGPDGPHRLKEFLELRFEFRPIEPTI